MNAESPRIAALTRAAAAGEPGAVAAFWQTVGSTPLIEPIPGEDSFCWVTLLWRSDEPLRNVVVQSSLNDGDQKRNQMTHIPGTDVWYITYRLRNDIRTTYLLIPNDPLRDWSTFDFKMPEARAIWDEYIKSALIDPLNPRRYVIPKDDDILNDHELIRSVLELPAAPPQVWSIPRPDVPAGKVVQHDYYSARLNNTRRVWIYTPPGYTPEQGSHPLLVLLDGWCYIHLIPTPTILDNLIAEKRIPPVIAVLVDNPGMNERFKELACSAPFVDFLADDLLPWVAQSHLVTVDPAKTTIGGSSLGGLTAAFAGLHRSNRFGNLLIQSGSLWWSPDSDPDPEWITHVYEQKPCLPLRFYLDVGLLETAQVKPGRPTQISSAQHFRDVLTAKGYPVTYAEFSGGHDYLCWRETLANGLIALQNHPAPGDGELNG